MKQSIAKIALALTIVAFTGCSTVTMNKNGADKLSTNPTYEDSKAYYLGGLIGENHINTKEICQDKGIKQMQSEQTFLDGLLTVVTLGIYAPHTAKVWCEE